MSVSTTTRKMNIWAIALSIIVPVAVVALLTPGLLPPINLPFDPYLLPPFYATINGLTAIVLVAAVYFIKQKKVVMHQRLVYLAILFSVIFLICYILYHGSTEPTRFGGEGPVRTVYYVLLISHIFLSAAVIPFVLFTFIRGFTGQFEKHRKLAKITFPLWLYVAVSGVVCYLMISPYYPA